MKKKSLFLLVVTLMISSILLSLVKFTKLPNESKNGFKRNLLPGRLVIIHHISSSVALEKICGETSNSLFLSVQNPQWLILTNFMLNKWDTILGMPIVLNDDIVTAHSLFIDSPDVYLYSNNSLKLFHHKIKETKVDSTNILTNLFSRAIQISPSSAIIRTFKTDFSDQIFQKLNISNGKVTLQKQIAAPKNDAGFSSDGFFTSDSTLSRIFYVEYHANTFFCIDTNLNVKYKGNTIDTTSETNFGVTTSNLPGTKKLESTLSRINVNKDSYATKDNLYIISLLIADNEKWNDFKNNSVIDVYDVTTGKYKSSFYVPDISGEKIKSLLVRNELLVALYKSSVAVFKIGK